MKKWKPKEGQRFWYVCLSITGSVVCYQTKYMASSDCHYISTGNFFRTKKEAQEALAKIKKVLKGEL